MRNLVDEKNSAADIDPTIVKLNDDLAAARKELDQSAAAASESWAELQGGVNDAFNGVRAKLNASIRRH